MPKISVCFNTIRRQPHFDWLFWGLSKQTYKDFELVIVDDASTQERYMEILKLSAKYHVNLSYYGRAKPTIWSRDGKNIRPAISNAKNTALIVANGVWTVWADDNSFAHPQWLEKHVQWAQFGLMSAGAHFSFKNGEPSDTETEVTAYPGTDEKVKVFYKGEIADGFDGRWRAKHSNPALPCEPGELYGSNMAFSIESATTVNGFDEELDGEQGQEDIDFGIRIRRAGFKIVFEPQSVVYYNNSSHSLTQYSIDALKAGWEKENKRVERKPKEKMLFDGKLHFSNEFHTQELLDKLSKIRVNPNFDLNALRQQYRTKFTMTHQLPEPTDWRDGEAISEME